MKPQTTIALKALFLLILFSLHTVVGFACAMGVDMGFNTKHHSSESTEAVVHIHKDGKKHVHVEKKGGHKHGKSHTHDHVNASHKESDKDNCCKDKVRQFEQLDKSAPTTGFIIYPLFSEAYVASTYFDIQLNPYTNVVKDIKPFVRSYHPPISDIRIAIQSFQI